MRSGPSCRAHRGRELPGRGSRRRSPPVTPSRRSLGSSSRVATPNSSAPLPSNLLSPDPDVRARLARFGLRRIGAVAELPRSALVARFGPEGERIHARARGEELERFVPRRAPGAGPPRLRIDPPVAETESLRFILHRLSGALAAQIDARGMAAGRATLRLTLEMAFARSGTPPELIVEQRFPEPTADADAIERLLLARLEQAPPPAAVERLELELAGVEPAVGQQLPLFVPQATRTTRLGWQARQARADVRRGPGPEGRRHRSRRTSCREALELALVTRLLREHPRDRRRAGRRRAAGRDPLERPARAGRGLQRLAGRQIVVARADQARLLQGGGDELAGPRVPRPGRRDVAPRSGFATDGARCPRDDGLQPKLELRQPVSRDSNTNFPGDSRSIPGHRWLPAAKLGVAPDRKAPYESSHDSLTRKLSGPAGRARALARRRAPACAGGRAPRPAPLARLRRAAPRASRSGREGERRAPLRRRAPGHHWSAWIAAARHHPCTDRSLPMDES